MYKLTLTITNNIPTKHELKIKLKNNISNTVHCINISLLSDVLLSKFILDFSVSDERDVVVDFSLVSGVLLLLLLLHGFLGIRSL